MFIQPCFIRKNSLELREKLKKLRYYVYDLDMNKDSPADWCTVIESEADYAGIWNKEPKNKEKFLDCGTNEELFLALAALRDDKDYMQWFTDGKNWILCDRDDFLDMYSVLCSGGKYNPNYLDKFHKATIRELSIKFSKLPRIVKAVNIFFLVLCILEILVFC